VLKKVSYEQRNMVKVFKKRNDKWALWVCVWNKPTRLGIYFDSQLPGAYIWYSWELTISILFLDVKLSRIKEICS